MKVIRFNYIIFGTDTKAKSQLDLTDRTTMSITSQVDREYLVRRSMSKGYQYASLSMPPLYTIFVLARRSAGAAPWSLNRMLRATWIGSIAGKWMIHRLDKEKNL